MQHAYNKESGRIQTATTEKNKYSTKQVLKFPLVDISSSSFTLKVWFQANEECRLHYIAMQ